MPLIFELIRKNEQTTSNWSGGTTTQIAIYPKQAVYAERNFIWRISSAWVDLEESTFTSLPGVARLIMVLEGEMRLEHAGHHSCYLKPYDQDNFSGDWTTKSYGKVRDFNLMLKGSAGGKLTALALPPQTNQQVDIHNPQPKDSQYMTSAFYCVNGTATVMIPHSETYTLTAGDVLLITTDQTESVSACLTNLTTEQVHLIRTDIWYQ